jgi:hypothetical protein
MHDRCRTLSLVLRPSPRQRCSSPSSTFSSATLQLARLTSGFSSQHHLLTRVHWAQLATGHNAYTLGLPTAACCVTRDMTVVPARLPHMRVTCCRPVQSRCTGHFSRRTRCRACMHACERHACPQHACIHRSRALTHTHYRIRGRLYLGLDR